MTRVRTCLWWSAVALQLVCLGCCGWGIWRIPQDWYLDYVLVHTCGTMAVSLEPVKHHLAHGRWPWWACCVHVGLAGLSGVCVMVSVALAVRGRAWALFYATLQGVQLAMYIYIAVKVVRVQDSDNIQGHNEWAPAVVVGAGSGPSRG